MQHLATVSRANNLLALTNQQFDVLVIGGGVTGAGVALDAAARGYSVALVEKNDFASGTSSKSTKLVHGGIRYLPSFDIAMVQEGLVERGILLRNAPHLVKPLGFVLPIYGSDRHPVGMPFTTPGGIGLDILLDMGLWAYDTLAGKWGIQRHRRLARKTVLEYMPDLVTDDLKGGFIYYDGQTNDARLTIALIQSAIQIGAVVTNHTEMQSFIKQNDQVVGVHMCDTLTDATFTIQARHIVNATGVYAEQIEMLTGVPPQAHIEPSKGVHLVLSRDDLKLGDAAVVLPETKDKRILFIVPWQSRIVFGTTDTGTGDLDNPTVSSDDIDYLLTYLNHYLSVKLTRDDIISTYAGYRPLVKPSSTGKQRSTAQLSRTHTVLQGSSGLLSIIGGKLTTYRRMAQDTVDIISQRDHKKLINPTVDLPLAGGTGWPQGKEQLYQQGIARGISAFSMNHLLDSYGTETGTIIEIVGEQQDLAQQLISDLPYIRAEVLFACHYEMAMTPEDFLARRTAITLEDRQRGAGIVADVVALQAQEYHWSDAYQQQLIQRYQSMMKQQMAIPVR